MALLQRQPPVITEYYGGNLPFLVVRYQTEIYASFLLGSLAGLGVAHIGNVADSGFQPSWVNLASPELGHP